VWKVNGILGREIGQDFPQKATVLITYFNPARMEHIDPQVRNVLKCRFVDRVIISNHNPDISIDQMVKVRDKRLIFINQEIKRGCGFRWAVAAEFDPEYLIVVDDDILLFPSQLAKLFQHLIGEPEIPHGFTGMRHTENGEFEYYERVDMDVDFLCEIYAVTRQNLRQYRELEHHIERDTHLSKLVDSSMDFMLISQTSLQNPRIHNVGRIFRCLTFNQAGIAVHKADDFTENMLEVDRFLNTADLHKNDLLADPISVEKVY